MAGASSPASTAKHNAMQGMNKDVGELDYVTAVYFLGKGHPAIFPKQGNRVNISNKDNRAHV